MKLHLAENQGQQRFTGYGASYVAVNNVRYERSVLVTPSSVSDWPVRRFEDLAVADFQFIAALKAEVVVFGTGPAQRFPGRELARALAASGAGVEVMDSKAACRTFNILAAEGRSVVAAILLDANMNASARSYPDAASSPAGRLAEDSLAGPISPSVK